MASSLLLRCFRSPQLALSSMKRTSSQLPSLAVALALPLAFLLPRLLPPFLSLFSHLFSFFTPVPIFLYANLLILAIVLSSSPPSHTFSCFLSPPPCHSYNVSDYHLPSESALQPLPTNGYRHTSLHWKKTPRSQPPLSGSKLGDSDCRSAPLAGVRPPSCRKSTVLPICSQATAAQGSTALEQRIAPVPDQEVTKLAISRPNLSVMKQLEQKQHPWTDGRIIRSKSDQRIYDPAVHPIKTLRRVETMDEASLVLIARCDEEVSSSSAENGPPIESLSDEDLNKRCEEFIARSRAKMRKELMDCTD